LLVNRKHIEMSSKYINKLQDKMVVVIGGSSGLGFAVAEACLEHGADLVVASRNQDNVDKAIARLAHAYPNATERTRGHICDLDSGDVEANLTALFEYATYQGSRKINHIVDTAGAPPEAGFQVANVTTDAAMDIARSRLVPRLLLAKMALKYANPQASSSLTFTSGVLTHRPQKGTGALMAAGGAKEVLCRGLAVEIAPIRVNVVSPGAIRTEMLLRMTAASGNSQAVEEGLSKATLLGVLGTPEDVAEAYLCSIKSNYMTGTTIHTEGGSLLKW
jgi:NAD(P)-dependent dehydrogenase (short-subunit alcohol dehydrogenase family)